MTVSRRKHDALTRAQRVMQGYVSLGQAFSGAVIGRSGRTRIIVGLQPDGQFCAEVYYGYGLIARKRIGRVVNCGKGLYGDGTAAPLGVIILER